MKKKRTIIIIIIVLIVIIIGYIIFNNDKNKNKSLLVVDSFSNHAWEPTFYGTAIFDDGSIYIWNFDHIIHRNYHKYIGDNNINTKYGLEDFILKRGYRRLRKVSNKDLDKLKKYINDLNDEDINFDVNCHGADIGNTIISVYKNNEELILSRSGDCDGNSKTYNVSKILSFIDKYL